MSYETNHCNRIVCDYPDCDATTRLWREDEDSAYSDADDLKWLTIEVELDGDEYVDRHFCPRHLDTTRPEWASEYIATRRSRPEWLERFGVRHHVPAEERMRSRNRRSVGEGRRLCS